MYSSSCLLEPVSISLIHKSNYLNLANLKETNPEKSNPPRTKSEKMANNASNTAAAGQQAQTGLHNVTLSNNIDLPLRVQSSQACSGLFASNIAVAGQQAQAGLHNVTLSNGKIGVPLQPNRASFGRFFRFTFTSVSLICMVAFVLCAASFSLSLLVRVVDLCLFLLGRLTGEIKLMSDGVAGFSVRQSTAYIKCLALYPIRTVAISAIVVRFLLYVDEPLAKIGPPPHRMVFHDLYAEVKTVMNKLEKALEALWASFQHARNLGK